MPVKVDASGRRSVQAEAEVPGTPEEVWQAIATGPGISSWFVPTEIQANKEGIPEKLICHFGPGTSMDSVSQVTSWDPPHRFTADSRDDMAPGDPTIATEWVVEARSGGTCLVRVVHSWFTSSDKWDNQYEGTEHGWVAFFRILRLYLTHFPGQVGSSLQFMGFTSPPVPRAWEALTTPLGLSGAAEGQHVETPAATPRLAGQVERVGLPEHPELLLRLEKPAPGIAHFFAMEMGGSVCMPARLYLFGSQAPATAAREEPLWQAWMSRQFPAAPTANPVVQESS